MQSESASGARRRALAPWLFRMGRAASKLVAGSQLIEYVGGPHGITDTPKDRLNNDLLAFVKK